MSKEIRYQVDILKENVMNDIEDLLKLKFDRIFSVKYLKEENCNIDIIIDDIVESVINSVYVCFVRVFGNSDIDINAI